MHKMILNFFWAINSSHLFKSEWHLRKIEMGMGKY